MSMGRPGRASRPWALGAGVLLAVVATATLVLTDDLALLRLAVVGALWAFLIAAFVAGARRTGPDPVSTEVTLRRSHERELEHEVALRREAELDVEIRVRQEMDTALRADIAGLRGEVLRLRQDIADGWAGELRVERVAVHAESTRVSGFGASFAALQDEARRLGDPGRPLFEVEAADGAGGPRPVLVPAAEALPGVEPSTVEFGAVSAADVPEQERTGPVHVSRVPPQPGPGPGRPRSRHQAGEEDGEDAAELVRRLSAETTGEIPVISAETAPPRRRRARDDDEINDVLARVLGGP